MSKTQIINLILPLFLTVTTAFAQQQASAEAEDVKPLTSEFNILRLEAVGKIIREATAEGRKTIIIARLGNGERSPHLNRRRLYNVQTFLAKGQGIGAENIVVAEGEKAQGYGRVEIYISGKLAMTLTVPKNQDLMVDCCEGDTNFYPSKDRLRLSRRKRTP